MHYYKRSGLNRTCQDKLLKLAVVSLVFKNMFGFDNLVYVFTFSGNCVHIQIVTVVMLLLSLWVDKTIFVQLDSRLICKPADCRLMSANS